MSRPSTSPSPRGRRARTGDVRAALVDAAWWVLEHDGLAGLTVRAVAARAEVAPMGVYNHLRDKDGLVTAVLTRGFTEFAAGLVYPAHLPAAEAMTAVGRAYRRFALAHPVAYGLMFGGERRQVRPPDDAELARAVDPDEQALLLAAAAAFDRLVQTIRAGQTAAVVREDPPEQVAWTVWSAVHGAVSLELAGALDDATGAARYDDVLALVLRGIAPS